VDSPVVVGGIIPDTDRAQLEEMGVARVYTPKDYRLATIMRDIAELAAEHRSGGGSSSQAGVGTRR
jgi:(2R)-ethylmalonyl-CoA mutase